MEIAETSPAGKGLTIGILLVACMAGMSLWFLTAAVLPDIAAEVGLSTARLSLLSSAVQAGFVAGAVGIAVTGLADRVDPRALFAVCAVLAAGANAALLVVPLDGALAVALRFAGGAFMAGVYPVGMKIAVGWGLKDRGLLVGALVGALTFGKSLPYGLAWLGGSDWRLTLGWGAVLAALGGVLVMFTKLGPHHARATGFRVRAIAVAWTDRRLRAAYGGYFGHMWELYVFWAWVGAASAASYAAAGYGDAVSLGKLTAFLAIAAGAPVCVVAGRSADRIGKARVAAGAMWASGGLALASAVAFGGPVWLSLGLFVLWGIAVIPDSAQFSALVADHAPAELTGSLLTLQTALGFGLTIVTVQLAPAVAEAFGWPVLLAGLALGPAFGIAALRPLWRAGTG